VQNSHQNIDYGGIKEPIHSAFLPTFSQVACVQNNSLHDLHGENPPSRATRSYPVQACRKNGLMPKGRGRKREEVSEWKKRGERGEEKLGSPPTIFGFKVPVHALPVPARHIRTLLHTMFGLKWSLTFFSQPFISKYSNAYQERRNHF